MPSTDSKNPFTDQYLRREVEFYGHPEPVNRDGLTLKYMRPQMRCDDYLNVNFHLDPGFDVPALIHSGTLWMSLTWMEVQSLVVPAALAQGRVATVGLGLGYFVLKVLEDQDVEDVTVYEKDPRVVRWFTDTFADRVGDRVKFVVGDAREVLRDQEFDYLFVDPYDTILPDEVVTDIELFCDNNAIGVYRFWGQELAYWLAMHAGMSDRLQSLLTWSDRKFFSAFLKSDGAKLRPPMVGNEDFVERVLDALEEHTHG